MNSSRKARRLEAYCYSTMIVYHTKWGGKEREGKGERGREGGREERDRKENEKKEGKQERNKRRKEWRR